MSTPCDPSNETAQSRTPGDASRWNRRFRIMSAGGSVAVIAAFGTVIIASGQEASAATRVTAAATPFGFGSDDPPVPGGMPADMPGMDMSGNQPGPTDIVNQPTPEPTIEMPAEMPGMDMSPHEHGDAGGGVVNRPLAPVLGTFGGGVGAVLLAAEMMRRKDVATAMAKRATRLAKARI
ncbi:MAG: hypothetical protein ABI662_02725 [Dermatophilaceae bacterium]